MYGRSYSTYELRYIRYISARVRAMEAQRIVDQYAEHGLEPHAAGSEVDC